MDGCRNLAYAVIRDDGDATAAEFRRTGCSVLAPGVPAICVAASFASASAAAALIGKGANVHARYELAPFMGWTALHWACLAPGPEGPNAALVKSLLAAGARPDARAADELLPLDISSDVHITRLLEDAGSPPRGAPGVFGRSQACCFLRMMSRASSLRASCFVEELLASGYPREMINWTDASGRTALHVASFAGSPAMCSLCIHHGARPDARDIFGASALLETISSYLPSPPVVRLLIHHGVEPSAEDVDHASKTGFPGLVALLLTGALPRPRGAGCGTGPSPLAARAFLDDALVHRNALALKAAVSTGAHDLQRALGLCSCLGTVEEMQILLKAGADPSGRIRAPESIFDGATALHCAAAGCAPAFVKMLAEAGADLDATLPCGLRPLDIARDHSVRDTLRSMGARAAPEAVRSSPAASAFRAALESVEALQAQDITRFQQAIGAGDQRQSDLLGETTLHMLVRERTSNAPDLVLWLVQGGAVDVNSRGYDGSTPLHRAVLAGDVQLVEVLLACGADPKAEDMHGFCSGRLAAYEHRIECLQILAQHAATTRRAAQEATQGCARPSSARRRLPRRRARSEARAMTPPPPEEMSRRAAAADEAASALLAAEEALKVKALRAAERRQRRAKQRRERDRATADGESYTERPITPGCAHEGRRLSGDEADAESEGDEGGVREPEWLAELLQEDRLGASQRISVQRSTATAPSVQFAWTPTVYV